MHLRGNIGYHTWEEFWEKGYRSPYFKAEYDDTSERTDWSLSERQLFTQSNGRILIGQDTMGRLHFACTPHERIYAVPSGGPDVGGQFKGHIGQYYQNDTALFLGKMKYEMELDNGLLLHMANQKSQTRYIDYYLPATFTEYPGIETKVFSFAPVLEKEARAVSDIHPLPGPAGVFFCAEVKNTSGCTLRGRLRLSFDKKFVNQFEHYGKRFEDYAVNPYKMEWEQKLLVMWHPEASAAIQLLDSVTSGEASNPFIYVPFELKEGESRLFTTILALTPERKDIHANLGILYQHTPLEWLNVTSAFWKERLGTIRTGIREDKEAGEKYADMHIRFILDNFNCLSFDEYGNLLTNWQGAPSHSLSRLWGIDIEPDVVSVMYAVPETGPKAMEYLAKRNTPRYSLYTDHSMFFYTAFLVIAGKYLELTGDVEYFISHRDISDKAEEIYQGMLKHKHGEKALFSSRYASDLIVFKKYDYGANVQCFYALKSYKRIRQALGKSTQEVDRLLARMPADMKECMEAEGPFGRQITGGSSLGENREERFYIPEELYYYGGEDTATVRAPLYGLYGFDYEPYVNLHRFARSLFITSYDPEFQTMRELHFGMNPSATGCILRLGGSYTRKEMLDTLKILYGRLDETGSLFWWPRADNKKRCLTRCSQGQGAWVQQSVEQWFGLCMDGAGKTLTIKPQGALTSYELTGVRLGNFCFDIQYEERRGETIFRVRNRNGEALELVLAVRPYGAAAEGEPAYDRERLAPGQMLEKRYKTEDYPVQEAEIVRKECRLLSEGKEIFAPYGIVMPKLYSGNCNIFLLRFVTAHLEEEEWEETSVELTVPEGWKAAEKSFYHWDYQPVFSGRKAVCKIGGQGKETHKVAGFYVMLPDQLTGDEKSVMLSEHPFPQTGDGGIRNVSLYVEGQKSRDGQMVNASLTVKGKVRKTLEIPVEILEREAYRQQYDIMYHGK